MLLIVNWLAGLHISCDLKTLIGCIQLFTIKYVDSLYVRMIFYQILFAQIGLTVNTPNSALSSGQKTTLTWTVTGAVPASIDFALLDGTATFNNAPEVATISSGVDPKALSLSWTVPNVPTGSKYFVRAGTAAAGYVYSGAFIINGSAKSSSASASPSSIATSTPTGPTASPVATAEPVKGTEGASMSSSSPLVSSLFGYLFISVF